MVGSNVVEYYDIPELRATHLLAVFGRGFIVWLFLGILSSTAAAASMHIPLVTAAASSRIENFSLGSWRLTVTSNHFSGQKYCRLRATKGKMVYAQSAIAFRFGQHVDTLRAWYSIDDNAARRWRDVLPMLAAQNTIIDGKNLDAPTDGIVWLPIAEVEKARKVVIQLHPNMRPKMFSMGQFAELRNAAHRLGCTSEAQFLW